MLQKVDGLDKTVRRVIDEHEEELLRIWNHQKLGEDLHTTWKESSVLADLEKLLSQIEPAPSELKRKRDRDPSETVAGSGEGPSDTDVLTPDFRVTDISENGRAATTLIEAPTPWPTQLSQFERGSANGEMGRVLIHSPVAVHSNQQNVLPYPSVSWVSLDLEKTPLPSFAPSLLDQYFTYTHCWFPILDRPYILKKFYEHTRSRNLVQPAGGDLACLWAICAYSHQQTKHLVSRSQQSHNETVSGMRAVARSLIPSECGPFAFGHVQALLLLVLLDIGLGEWTSAWMLIGYAVRAVLELKASHEQHLSRTMPSGVGSIFASHGNDVNPQSTPIKHSRWQALFQGCFILDTMISYHLVRPPQLRADHLDLEVGHLVSEDGHEEWEPWIDSSRDSVLPREPAFVMSCFNRLTELCVILSRGLEAALYNTPLTTISTQEAISQLSALSERYPCDVQQLAQRPLHHMLLQAWHSVVKMSLATPYSRERRFSADFSTMYLRYFDEAWNLPDRCGVPSILISLLNPFLDERPLWPSSAHVFREESMNPMVPRLIKIWPGIKPDPTKGTGLASATPPSQSTQPYTSLSSMRPSFPPVPRSSLDAFASSLKQSNFPTIGDNTDYTLPQREIQPSGTMPLDYEPMSLDPSNQNQMTFDSALIAQKETPLGLGTSPSFNGDEIDALFHEMAQLDTTQWTMGRTQGLRDFGFADDSTFEAFCNDPARLMLSDAYMGPAFNHGGNAGNPSSGTRPSVLNHDGAHPGRMSFEDLFR